MSDPKLILLVKFRTALSLDKIMEIARDRAADFRALSGLRQKYYFRDAASGEVGGLYVWESQEALNDYRESELRASIASAYQTIGQPRIEVLDILMQLRDAAS